MRLGKTVVCIRWLIAHPREPQLIAIIAPKTVLISWEIELAGEGHPHFSYTDGSIEKRRARLAAPEPGFHLLNYECVKKLSNELSAFDAIVCDESVYIKNPSADVTKALLKLSKIVPIRACLSGLPNPESWEDVWSQTAFTKGGEWMGYSNFWDWRNHVFSQFGFDWLLSPKNMAKVKSAFHADAFVLTRKQAGIRDVKVRQRRQGTMPPATRAVYDRISKSWEHPCGTLGKHKMVVINWLRQLCGGLIDTAPCPWKVDELVHILTKELPTEQIVVWFAYNQELTNVWHALKPHSINATWITGTTKQADRRERMLSFQRGERRVMLIQQACGQYGIDLSAADSAIYYSSTYRYGLRAQSEERIYQVGKTRDLLIIDFVTKDSVDEVVLESVANKKNDASFLMSKLNLQPPT